jgi:phosphoglycerate-specific signal transduction histidine kinase
MSSLKQYKAAEKSLAQQKELVTELQTLVRDIERCEKTVTDLRGELEAVNEQHKERKTTRDDIAYLEALLKCAHKKLAWEKQIASLKKRTPSLLERLSALVNDPVAPPSNEMRAAMLQSLQGVQQAMERLEKVKID